jgi:hypothetical protein
MMGNGGMRELLQFVVLLPLHPHPLSVNFSDASLSAL